MNYVISTQFLDLIETALKSKESKDIIKAIEAVTQTKELNKIDSTIDPLVISKLWQQECPSIHNFAQTLIHKTFNN